MALSAGSLTFPVFFTAFIVVQAQGGHHSHSHGLGVSSLHTSYVCPEGANATLVCTQSGSKAHLTDVLKHVWFFTPHMDQHCKNILHPRIHGNRTLGVVHKVHDSAFSLTLMEVTKADEGRYCCQSTEVLGRDKNNHTKLLHAHSNMILTVHSRDDSAGQNKNPKCMEFDIRPPAGSSVAAGLASAVCIMGVLCLPLILLLVYRQRQGAQRSRRAHELVRMDSEAQGHDNPVFMGGSPKPRTVSAILTRQPSESGRHLLSDPGTPFSPSTHGDVFFPAQEPIPESHDFLPA